MKIEKVKLKKHEKKYLKQVADNIINDGYETDLKRMRKIIAVLTMRISRRKSCRKQLLKKHKQHEYKYKPKLEAVNF